MSDVSRDKPTFTPASASASMMRKMYAGPLPESPVTASSKYSSTTTVFPTASNSIWAVAMSSSEAWSPPERAVAPAPIKAGTLGMTRMTRE